MADKASASSSTDAIHAPSEALSETLRRASEALGKLQRLEPLDALDSVKGTAFGRNIASEVARLREQQQLLSLAVYRRKSAVVVPAEVYKRMLDVQAACEALVEAAQARELEAEGDAFEALYARISAPASRAAADAAFAADGAALGRHHRPGDTESAA